MREITSCEVCGNPNLRSVLDLGNHPLCDDLVPIGDSRVCKEYPIEILFCDTCYTAHQRFQVCKTDLFPATYNYRARMTPSVLRFMSDLVDECGRKYGPLAGKWALDIGCNDGSLLNYFRLEGARTIGVDPTGAAADAEASGHTVFRGFFDETIAAAILQQFGNPDFITFTNVFAHIEDLQGLVKALRILIGNTVVIVENHYMGAILRTNQFDTFYHEHPRTYSLRSFQFIAKSLGLNLEDVEFPTRYGGNIRVWLGKGVMRAGTRPDESSFGARFAEIEGHMEAWRDATRNMIDNYVAQHGAIRAKAFPGRAAILIKLLGVDAESISNLAWHLPSEVRANLARHGYKGEVIDVMPVKACS